MLFSAFGMRQLDNLKRIELLDISKNFDRLIRKPYELILVYKICGSKMVAYA